jgi:hypothetical protein
MLNAASASLIGTALREPTNRHPVFELERLGQCLGRKPGIHRPPRLSALGLKLSRREDFERAAIGATSAAPTTSRTAPLAANGDSPWHVDRFALLFLLALLLLRALLTWGPHLISQRYHHRRDVLAVPGRAAPAGTRTARLPAVAFFVVLDRRPVRLIGRSHRDLAADRVLFLVEVFDRLAACIQTAAQECVSARHALNRTVAHRSEFLRHGSRRFTPRRRFLLGRRVLRDCLVFYRFLESSFGHRMRAVINLNGVWLEASGTYTGLRALRLSPRCAVARSAVGPGVGRNRR